MKKTLSISIGGRVFQIEEDAYITLDTYLQTIHARYSHDASMKELVDDIESSISEKFEQRLAGRSLVVLQDVEQVISVMGKPEEIDQEPLHEAPIESVIEKGQKRLYRNPDDKMIAGVCSGIAAYLGMDVVFVRLVFVLLGIINGIGVIAYIVLWIVMPEAQTISQKLAMKGKQATISELQEVIAQKAKAMAKEGEEAFNRIKKS